jgi:FAD synthetase
MTTVVATGAFTILHPGHVLYLEEAKKLGDKLIVIVARDTMVEKRKNQRFVTEEQRLAVVKALKPVDDAILGDDEDIYKPILRIRPDILALGKDQDFNEEELAEELRKRGLRTRVVRIQKYWMDGLHSSRHIIARIREKDAPESKKK